MGFDIEVTAAKCCVHQNISGHVSMALMSFATSSCQNFLSLSHIAQIRQRDIVDYNLSNRMRIRIDVLCGLKNLE